MAGFDTKTILMIAGVLVALYIAEQYFSTGSFKKLAMPALGGSETQMYLRGFVVGFNEEVDFFNCNGGKSGRSGSSDSGNANACLDKAGKQEDDYKAKLKQQLTQGGASKKDIDKFMKATDTGISDGKQAVPQMECGNPRLRTSCFDPKFVNSNIESTIGSTIAEKGWKIPKSDFPVYTA